jgi:hypothetical protein
MAAKNGYITEKELRKIPLPTHSARYSVVPHGTIIDEIKSNFIENNFDITSESYKSTLNGEIALGKYEIDFGYDKDLKLMFGWSNSYNRQKIFKCASGASVLICMNGMVSGDFNHYSKKHYGGKALNDIITNIKYQINHAKKHYDRLVLDKEMLKDITLTKKDKASIVGDLYINEELINISQTAIVNRELKNPTHYYHDPNSAWDLYNYVTFALKESHVANYIEDHEKLHTYFVDRFGDLQTTNEITPFPSPTLEYEEEEELFDCPSIRFV